MDQLLVMLMFSAGDAIQAERLLDYIAILNGKKPKGHCLLVAAPDLHGEMTTKIKIAAEVAFETVELLAVPWPAIAHTTKSEAINYTFYSGITHASRCYQWPVLLVEPDCVPLRNSWVGELEAAYYDQPKRYLGSILSSPDGKVRHLSRVAIYPRGAGGEMKELCAGKTPFELAAGGLIVPRAGKTKLIQQLRFKADTDRTAIRDTAVLLHGDKEAVLLSALIDEAITPTARLDTNHTKPNPAWTNAPYEIRVEGAPPVHVGPPPAGYPQAVEAGVFEPSLASDPEPRDKRTNAWKKWKANQQQISETNASAGNSLKP